MGLLFFPKRLPCFCVAPLCGQRHSSAPTIQRIEIQSSLCVFGPPASALFLQQFRIIAEHVDRLKVGRLPRGLPREIPCLINHLPTVKFLCWSLVWLSNLILDENREGSGCLMPTLQGSQTRICHGFGGAVWPGDWARRSGPLALLKMLGEVGS